MTTFLHQQRTSLSGEPKPEPPEAARLPPPNAILRITPRQIRRYAAIGGDRNPIHTSVVGARLFGFPTVIAHGMFSAAAVLANIEGQIPDAVRYTSEVRQAGAAAAAASLYIERVDGGWDIALRNIASGLPRNLTGTVRAL